MISAIERKILQKLDQDVRTPVTQIAKYAHTSQENVTYHLQKLQEKGILTGYWGMPRFGKNTAAYKFFFKDKGFGKHKKDFITYLLKKRDIVWIAESHGTWDYVIAVVAESEQQGIQTIRDLLKKYGTHIGDRTLIRYATVHSLNEKYLHKTNYIRIHSDNFTYESHLDQTDKAIQNELLRDARQNFSKIARTIGVSPETVRTRAKRVLDEEILDLKIRIDHKKLGLEYYHIMLAIQDHSILQQILHLFKQHNNCVFIGEHIGEYDIHLELVVAEDELQQITNMISEKFGNQLRKYDTLHIHKEHSLKVYNDS